jgi:predicted DNA-binding protein with PD1-like motif
MKSRELTPKKTYLVRLIKDEDVLPVLTEFCKREGIVCGSFTAIGAVKQAKIGYYDLTQKKYGTIEYPHEMEVASMIGNVALVDGEPFIHTHAVLSDMQPGNENKTVGGHVFGAIVAVTLEVRLDSFDQTTARALDEEIGLKLLDL